jgi:proteasome accessory factor C
LTLDLKRWLNFTMTSKRQRHALTGEARLNLIIGLTTYLNDNWSATISELAEHFDVSKDEIVRAVSAMYNATVADGHESWAMSINDDWRADDMVELRSQVILDGNPRISARQAAALAAGLSVLAGSASEADKVEIESLIHLLSQGTVQSAQPSTVAIVPGTIDADFAKMRRAIIGQKRVAFEYLDNRGELTQREIDPIKLESNDQIWNVRGYCHLRQEERAFRLDRMRGSVVLDEPWSKEAHELELDDAIYAPSDHDTKVLIDVTPEAYDLIGNFNGEIISSHGDNNEIQRIEISVGYLPNLGKLIAGYGGAAKVISPPEARQIVRDFALKALKRKPLDTAKD